MVTVKKRVAPVEGPHSPSADPSSPASESNDGSQGSSFKPHKDEEDADEAQKSGSASSGSSESADSSAKEEEAAVAEVLPPLVPEDVLLKDTVFAEVCSFIQEFGDKLKLPPYTLNELLEDLQKPFCTPALKDLFIALLRKSRGKFVPERWEQKVVRFGTQYNLLECDEELAATQLRQISVFTKLRVLKLLCNFQFDYNDKFKENVLTMPVEQLRIQPLGYDSSGYAYWFIADGKCSAFVYKELPVTGQREWLVVCNTRDGLASCYSELKDHMAQKYPIRVDDKNAMEKVDNTDSVKDDEASSENKEVNEEPKISPLKQEESELENKTDIEVKAEAVDAEKSALCKSDSLELKRGQKRRGDPECTAEVVRASPPKSPQSARSSLVLEDESGSAEETKRGRGEKEEPVATETAVSEPQVVSSTVEGEVKEVSSSTDAPAKEALKKSSSSEEKKRGQKRRGEPAPAAETPPRITRKRVQADIARKDSINTSTQESGQEPTRKVVKPAERKRTKKRQRKAVASDAVSSESDDDTLVEAVSRGRRSARIFTIAKLRQRHQFSSDESDDWLANEDAGKGASSDEDEDYVGPSEEPVGRNKKRQDEQDEEENEDTPCQQCGKFTQSRTMLLCDTCDAGYHMNCLIPQLEEVPSGDWFCPACQQAKLVARLGECLDKLDAQLKKRDSQLARCNAAQISRERRLAAIQANVATVLKENFTTINTKSSLTGEDMLVKRSCRTRSRPVDYSFKDYDDQIKDAVANESDGSGDGVTTGLGQGKVISNCGGEKKKRRALNKLSSDESGASAESEEYRASDDSASSEEFQPSAESPDSDFTPARKPTRQSQRRSRRSRKYEDTSDSGDNRRFSAVPSRRSGRIACKPGAPKKYAETSSDEAEVVPRATRRIASDSDEEEDDGKPPPVVPIRTKVTKRVASSSEETDSCDAEVPQKEAVKAETEKVAEEEASEESHEEAAGDMYDIHPSNLPDFNNSSDNIQLDTPLATPEKLGVQPAQPVASYAAQAHPYPGMYEPHYGMPPGYSPQYMNGNAYHNGVHSHMQQGYTALPPYPPSHHGQYPPPQGPVNDNWGPAPLPPSAPQPVHYQ